MATLAQIRTKVDNFLTDLWVNKIIPKEEAYFALHGRYAQVLISPENVLADDVEGAFIKRLPSDEQFPADFEFTIATPIPASIEIHTHDRGDEHGFTAHVWIQVLGKTYHRSKNFSFGSQDQAWHEFLSLT